MVAGARSHLPQGLPVSEQHRRAVVQTCIELKLPICVQVTALEYLDRFLVQHVRDLREQLGAGSPACANVSWDSVMGRMREQVMLRMLSCIQIASKMFSSVRPGYGARGCAAFESAVE
ncbi:hypothetical protein HPB52_015114 [Rhipicephalus sanguineus]|uniref:Uncharacterized protein n=1 Tax=Rhipicephalus sanguineus TaxID=34632 RepID=A0A9D4PWM5_RHISA|nr:hypothetical protein HPB52_015114 [Rhipicephalus sanguineus]